MNLLKEELLINIFQMNMIQNYISRMFSAIDIFKAFLKENINYVLCHEEILIIEHCQHSINIYSHSKEILISENNDIVILKSNKVNLITMN